jgi:hypothetical protein
MQIHPPADLDDDRDIDDFLSDIILSMESTDEIIYVDNTPAIEYILTNIDLMRPYRLKKYCETRHLNPTGNATINQLSDYFFKNINIRNKYQCNLDGTPTQCVNHALDAMIREYPEKPDGEKATDEFHQQIYFRNIDNWYMKLEILFESMRSLLTTDQCKIDDNITSCVDKTLDEIPWNVDKLGSRMIRRRHEDVAFSNLIREVGSSSNPGVLCRHTFKTDTGEPQPTVITCLQKMLMTMTNSEEYSWTGSTIGSYYDFRKQFTQPVFQLADGTMVTGYDWLTRNLNTPGNISVLYNLIKYPDTQFTKATCHADDGETTCIDAFINWIRDVGRGINELHIGSQDGRDLPFLLRGKNFDASTLCRHNGTMVPCLVKIFDVLDEMNEAPPKHHAAPTVVSLLTDAMPFIIKYMSISPANQQCGDDYTSCLDAIIARVTNTDGWDTDHHQINIIMELMRDDDVKHATCGPEHVNCLKYIMSQSDRKYALLYHPRMYDILFDDFGTLRVDMVEKICTDDNSCKNMMCEAITTHVQEEEIGGDLSPKLITSIDAVCSNCNSRPTKKAIRECYDERCFDLSNAYHSSPWMEEYAGVGMKYRPSYDTFDLCGVYDIKYIPINDPNEVEEYRKNVRKLVETINTAFAPHSVDVRLYDHITKTATVIPSRISLETPSMKSSDDALDTVLANYISIDDGRVVKQIKFGFSRILSRLKELRKIGHDALIAAIETVVKTKPSEKEVNLKLVISNRPNDLMRASMCQDWQSCFNLADGQYRNTIHSIIDYSDGYIAYLAKDEYAPSWLARVYLIPCNTSLNGEKCIMIENTYRDYAINRVYARVLYDALETILYDQGFNTSGCPTYCDAKWVDEFTLNYDDVYDQVYYENIDEYQSLAIDKCMEDNLNNAIDNAKQQVWEELSDEERVIFEDDPYQFIDLDEIKDDLFNGECSEDGDIVTELIDEYVDNDVQYHMEDADIQDIVRESYDGYEVYLDTEHCEKITEERIKSIQESRGDSFVNLVEKMSTRDGHQTR